jgi:hypothetical protein
MEALIPAAVAVHGPTVQTLAASAAAKTIRRVSHLQRKGTALGMGFLVAGFAQQHDVSRDIRPALAFRQKMMVFKTSMIAFRLLRPCAALPAAQAVPQIHQKTGPIIQRHDGFPCYCCENASGPAQPATPA